MIWVLGVGAHQASCGDHRREVSLRQVVSVHVEEMPELFRRERTPGAERLNDIPQWSLPRSFAKGFNRASQVIWRVGSIRDEVGSIVAQVGSINPFAGSPFGWRQDLG